MNPTDPQFVYMVLVLPGMFGVTMVGEGVSKVVHYQISGWLLIILGMVFISMVGLAYLFISGIL
jgi:hypothetical protein